MQEEPISYENSLKIITEMIDATKNKSHKLNSYHYLVWGYLVFIASLGQFFLIKLGLPEISYYTWFLMIIGFFVSIWIGKKQNEDKKVQTYIDNIMRNIWFGFLGGFISLCCCFQPYTKAFLPLVMILYGICLFISGCVIRFKPSKFGGFFCWFCGIFSFYLPTTYQLPVIALAVLVSYIIPGHLLYQQAEK